MVGAIESLLVAPAAHVPVSSGFEARPQSGTSATERASTDGAFQLSLSSAANNAVGSASGSQSGARSGGQDGQRSGGSASGSGGPSSAGGEEELSEDEQAEVDDLEKRDREVRAHEQAHATAGGPYAGAPKYQFTTGPDNKRYATSGEVDIDVSPEKTPEATIRKMDIVIRAALAPAEPSTKDIQVARLAQQQRADAQNELQQQSADELKGGGAESEAAPGSGGEQTGLLQEDGKEKDSERSQNAQSAALAARAYQAVADAISEGGGLFGAVT